ncbi:MAG: DUF6164 family protein [Mariprofundaceae bacterium]|nr:DUF6164 family protein [Mariprofundaceae bacterium]
MPVMLFKLRQVEEDEADEIRVLLKEKNINFYETNNGRWGLGFAAIWLHDDAHLNTAQAAIDVYQTQRTEQARAAYAARCLAGEQETVWHKIKASPVQVMLYFMAALVIAALSLLPFVLVG